ncbi:MAG: carboxymuconolactone decarboxylase family protein [Sneathiella sp.]
MQRINIQERVPEAYKAMFGLEKFIAGSTIDAELQELVRLRASVINGCKLCIGMHSDAAKKIGVNGQKIAAIKEWQNSSLFSSSERAVLRMTDAITLISVDGLPDDIYQKVSSFFEEDEVAQIIMIIVTINAWNRLGVSMAEE